MKYKQHIYTRLKQQFPKYTKNNKGEIYVDGKLVAYMCAEKEYSSREGYVSPYDLDILEIENIFNK